MFSKMKHACHHMYALLRQPPTITDASIRWRVGYRNDYGRTPDISDHYILIRGQFYLSGVIIFIEEVNKLNNELYAPGHGDQELRYFQRSLNRLFLRGDVTYWTEHVARFSPRIQKFILGTTQEPKKYKPSHSATQDPKKSKHSHPGGIVEHDNNDSIPFHPN